MKYSNYLMRANFEGNLKRLNAYQMDKVFKIVSVESHIQAINFQKDRIKVESKKHYYDIDIMTYTVELSRLTGNLHPENLLKKMVNFSE